MKRIIIMTIFVLATLIIAQASVHAIDPFADVCSGEAATSSACQSRTQENPLLGPNGTLTRVISLIIRFTAVIAVFMLIVGGFRYVISAGDSNSINGAKIRFSMLLLALLWQ